MKTLTVVCTSMMALIFTTLACSRERGQVVTPTDPMTKKNSSEATEPPSDDIELEGETIQGSGPANDNNTLVKPDNPGEDITPQTSTPDTSTTKSCFEELQAKFGMDIVFPAQQLLPKQYEQARAQGANGQAALKTMLMSASCSKLKENE